MATLPPLLTQDGGFWRGVYHFNALMRAAYYLTPRRRYPQHRYYPQPQHHANGWAWFLFIAVIIIALARQARSMAAPMNTWQ